MAVAQGFISLAEENLRLMLADATAFRTWTGATTQAKALARVYVMELPPPQQGDEYPLYELQAFRPYALIWTSDDSEGFVLDADAVSSDSFEFAASGTLLLDLVQDVDPSLARDPSEIYRRFVNSIGLILDDLRGLAGQAGYLAFRRVALVEGPNRAHPKLLQKQGDFVDMRLRFEWSGR